MGLKFGQRLGIKSAQEITIQITSTNTSNAGAITAVDTANTVVKILGIKNDGSGGANYNVEDNSVNAELTNATTVTVSRLGDGTPQAATIDVRVRVVEYEPGVIKSKQTVTVDMDNDADGIRDVTINSVTTGKVDVIPQGKSGKMDITNPALSEAYWTLTSATNLRLQGRSTIVGTCNFKATILETY